MFRLLSRVVIATAITVLALVPAQPSKKRYKRRRSRSSLPKPPNNPPNLSNLRFLVQNSRGIDLGLDKTRPVCIEFLNSPRLTDELRAELARSGFSIAADKAAAEVVYELDGAYQARRPATGRTAEIRAGDFAEKPESRAVGRGRRSTWNSRHPWLCRRSLRPSWVGVLQDRSFFCVTRGWPGTLAVAGVRLQ
jgi:hypothetical protein